MWRRPLVVRRVHRSTGNTCVRLSARPSVANNHGSRRCIHSTCSRQTPNLHALIAERLKQYVDPNGAKPTRTYADRLGTFDPSPSKRVNERTSASRNGTPPKHRLSANRRIDADADEHFHPVEPRSRRHQARQWSERAASPRNSSDAGSSSTRVPHESMIGVASKTTDNNRFASAAKPSTSTAGSHKAEKAPQARNQTKKDRTSKSFSRVPDTFGNKFSAARRDYSTMTTLRDEVKDPHARSPARDGGRQQSPPEQRVEAPKTVNEANPATTTKDSLTTTKPLIGEMKTSKEPTRATEAVPHQKVSPEDRKTYKSWPSDPSLPLWARVSTPGWLSQMLDDLSDTLRDVVPLYCDFVTSSYPRAMLLYTPKTRTLFQIDLGRLSRIDMFSISGTKSKQLSLAHILRESQHRLFFLDVRKAADVLSGFYNVDVKGACGIQLMQSMSRPAPEMKNLEESVTDYLSETDQSLEKYQRLLKEKEVACQDYKEGIMSQITLPAVRNVHLYQFSLMPQFVDYYGAKLGGEYEQCLEDTARRLAQTRKDHEGRKTHRSQRRRQRGWER